MKKLWMILLTAALLVVLGACNQTAEDVSGSNSENNGAEQEKQEVQEEPKEEEKELTLEEVYNKTMEASNSLQSFSMTTDLEMSMTSNVQEGAMNMSSSTNGQIVTEPLAMYQQLTTSIEGTQEAIDTEMYVTEDGFFFLEPSNQTWLKMPNEMSTQILGEAAGQQNNPGAELASLQQFIDDFEFQKDETNYILTLKANGEKFVEFANQMLQSAMPQDYEAMGNAFENMAIENLEYEMFIDQTSFYPTKLNMNLSLTITEGEETLNMDMKMNGSYADFNSVTVEVPQEVIDTAQDITAETGL
ncbi:MAG TPA: DUF6612 family protein [Bacillus sp. (in: firmicutes)]|uniref:DUF6612 family protein n=1 Tax=Bacillus litorisediminis TaxID=2922713 RepID=UPI001FABB4E5|nr:DUF6612 family protein [Bacillus litorisediminis]HWO75691.1 DUF6612 family protein [Bacillus sp. (in: firmicutes)]